MLVVQHELSVNCHSVIHFMTQAPPSRSEQEIAEDVELKLALALSRTEAEGKEKEVTDPFCAILYSLCYLSYCIHCVICQLINTSVLIDVYVLFAVWDLFFYHVMRDVILLL